MRGRRCPAPARGPASTAASGPGAAQGPEGPAAAAPAMAPIPSRRVGPPAKSNIVQTQTPRQAATAHPFPCTELEPRQARASCSQAADIMTDLLGGGGGRHADTPGDAGPWGDEGWEEDREADDLETPLSVRWAGSTACSTVIPCHGYGAGTWVSCLPCSCMWLWASRKALPSIASLHCRLAKSASRSASEERDGGARRHSGPAKRSRLAHASGPHGDDEEGEGCDGEAAGEEAAQPQQEEQQGPEAEDEAEPGVQGGSRGAANITAEGAKGALQPAQRYSVRQLAKLESKPIALHKGTPLPGTMPPPTDQKK